MTTISRHPITVNGVDLQNYCYNITNRAGWTYLPGTRSKNPPVPGRHGAIYRANKRREEGRMVLDMWCSSFAPNGVASTGDRYAAWKHNIDSIATLFDSAYALLDVRQTIQAGEVRQAFCDVQAAINPVVAGQDPYSPFVVELLIPDVWWRDLNPFAWSSPSGIVAPTNLVVAGAAGITAPIEDAVYSVHGPVSGPVIQDQRTGHYASLNAFTLSDTQTWILDTGAWTSVVREVGHPDLDVRGITFAYGTHLPRYMTLSPPAGVAGAAPGLFFTGVGGSTGAATQVSVAGYRKFK